MTTAHTRRGGTPAIGDPEFPTKRDERWKYTPVSEVLARLDTTTPAVARSVDRETVDALAGRHGGIRLVFVNGFHVPELSELHEVAGLWCGTLDEVPEQMWQSLATIDTLAPVDAFDALNLAAESDTAVVVLDPRCTVAEPVHIIHIEIAGEQSELTHPRLLVVVGDGSELSLIETYTGAAGKNFTNASTVIELGAHASLTHHRIQNEASGATHIGHTSVHQGERSHYTATSVLLGADIARHAIDVSQHGDHAVSDLSGLYTPVGHQRDDFVVTVDHAAAHGRSAQRFTGVIDDHATGSFGGRVIVRADTAGNDARQSNRNLLLTPNAQANTRPWLEILAEDVQCTHGATVGRLDQEAMFYLRSRGIPRDMARTMLIDGFIDEITESITPPSLRDHVAAAVAARHLERTR